MLPGENDFSCRKWKFASTLIKMGDKEIFFNCHIT